MKLYKNKDLGTVLQKVKLWFVSTELRINYAINI